MEAILDVPLGT